MSNRIVSRWRYLGALLVLGLIAWLAVAPPPEDRFQTLTRLVDSGAIGTGSSSDLMAFELLVRQATSAAGITAPIVVNVRPAHGAVHFYLTDSRVEEFTRCRTGNACYDASLDAVFVDKSLFKPQELTQVGVSSFFSFIKNREYAFTRTFLSLILLHELGHRALHSSNGAFFDGTNHSIARDKELAADDFALAAFKRGFAKGVYGKDEGIVSEVAFAGIHGQLSADDTVTATLLFAAAQMSTGLLFTRGNVSSLYEDASHPSYGFRIGRLGEVLAQQTKASPVLEPFATFFRARVERVDSFRRIGLLEVSGEEPIAGIAFDVGGMTVVDQDWNVFHVPTPRLRPRSPDEPRSLVLTRIGRAPIAKSQGYLARMWSTTDGSVYVYSSNGLVFSVKGQDIRLEPELAKLFTPSVEILTPPGPGNHLVLDDGSAITLLTGGTQGHKLAWSELMRPVLASGATHTPTARSVSHTGAALHVAVHDNHGPLVGSLIVPLVQPFTPIFVRLNITGEIDLTGELVTLGSGQSRRYFLTGRRDLQSKVTVWELDPVRPPTKRIEYSPLLDSLSSLPIGGQNVPVVVSSVLAVSTRHFLIKLPADSILRYDVEANTLEPVFVATGVHMTPSADGAVAFTTLNAYKAFILP